MPSILQKLMQKSVARAVTVVMAAMMFSACGRTPPIEGSSGLTTSTIWVDKGPDVGQFDSLVADSKGVPHVSYYSYAFGDLKYAKLNVEKGTWDVQTIDSEGDVGLYTSLAVDSQDNPHVVYYDLTNNRLKYAYFNGLEWRSTSFDSDGGLFASLAIDANDVSHISYIGTAMYDLHYMRWDSLRKGATRFDVTLDTGTITGPSGVGGIINGGTSIKIRPESQRPIIAYYHGSFGALQVMRLDPDSESARKSPPGAGWVLDVIDGNVLVGDAKDDVGEHSALFVAGENDFHISYYNKTRENLNYAHWDGDRWTHEMVDGNGLVGESTSITVVCKKPKAKSKAECRPYISYFDSTNNDLKVATRRPNSSWVTFRADLAGMTGTYTSIAVVRGQRIGISYRDLTYSGLKFLLFYPF